MQIRAILISNITTRHPVSLQHDTYKFCFNKEFLSNEYYNEKEVRREPNLYVCRVDVLNFPICFICYSMIYLESSDQSQFCWHNCVGT